MADDPTPTPNSDPTPTPSPTPSDPPADPAPAAPPAADPPADPNASPANPDATALGGAGDPPADPPADQNADPNAAPAVPETYELTVPDGFEKLDDQAVADATPVFKELGLTNEQANKLVPIAAGMAKRVVEQHTEQMLGQFLETKKGWLESAKKDPEIGGTGYAEAIQAAARAMDRLGFPSQKNDKGEQINPLRKVLNESGVGDHPEVIRFMARVGRAIGEDPNFVRGDTNAKVPKTAEEVFWPGQSERKA